MFANDLLQKNQIFWKKTNNCKKVFNKTICNKIRNAKRNKFEQLIQ